jgi:hypothetical protein
LFLLFLVQQRSLALQPEHLVHQLANDRVPACVSDDHFLVQCGARLTFLQIGRLAPLIDLCMYVLRTRNLGVGEPDLVLQQTRDTCADFLVEGDLVYWARRLRPCQKWHSSHERANESANANQLITSPS